MIIRSPRPESHYLTIANTVVRDRSLSFKARGILALLLSYPDNWSVSSERLARETPLEKGEKRDAIRTGLKELESAGYLIREVRKDPSNGRFSTHTYVYDTPRDGDKPRDKPTSNPQPETDYPSSENPSPKELPTKNTVKRKSVVSYKEKGLKRLVCPQCYGRRWIVTDDDLIACECKDGLLKV